MDLETVRFLNQTRDTSKVGLGIGAKYKLGGRDALIIANFMLGKIDRLVTMDGDLLGIREVKSNGRVLRIIGLEDL